jgi:hypothetical protein
MSRRINQHAVSHHWRAHIRTMTGHGWAIGSLERCGEHRVRRWREDATIWRGAARSAVIPLVSNRHIVSARKPRTHCRSTHRHFFGNIRCRRRHVKWRTLVQGSRSPLSPHHCDPILLNRRYLSATAGPTLIREHSRVACKCLCFHCRCQFGRRLDLLTVNYQSTELVIEWIIALKCSHPHPLGFCSSCRRTLSDL